MNVAKRTVAVVCVLSLFFVLFGCKGKKSGGKSDEMVIQTGLVAKIKSMDPVSVRDVYTAQVVYHIFEPLFQHHYLKRPYEIEPLVADGMPEISEDLLSYTIKIKKGILFQDDVCFAGGKGRELKAEDFVYGLKRVADIKNLSENWSSLDDKIVGLDEFREYTKSCAKASDVDYSREVDGLAAADDYTLVIRLKKPWPNIIDSALTDLVTSPIAKEAVDYYGRDIVSHPIGTGPFMLSQWRRGSYVEVVRNPNYRGDAYPSEGEPGDAEAGYLDDAGKRMPFVDRIVWRILEEQQPAWLLFMRGKLDAKAIPKDNWAEAMAGPGQLTEKMKQLNMELKSFNDPSVFWIGFNMEDPVLGGNKALRRAISYAIDREKFIDLFFNGRDMVAHGFVPPELDSYDAEIKRFGYAEYNLEKAKALLKEAEKIHGGPIGKLTLTLPGTDTFYRQFGQFFARQFEEAGLEVEMDYMDWPTYQKKVNGKNAQMFAAGISAGNPDAGDILDMFCSKNAAPGPNKFNYSSAEYDKLFEKVEVMGASAERLALYRKLELMILEDCPAAFINHRVAYVLHHRWYKNYKPHVFAYGLGKYRRIDMEKRAAYEELLKKVKQ